MGRFSGAAVAAGVFLVVFAAALADTFGVAWLAWPAALMATAAGWMAWTYFGGGLWQRFRRRRNRSSTRR